MITCGVQYRINPSRLGEFEHYARLRSALVKKYGGTHYGFLMPFSGENDMATAFFMFSSMAEYAIYIAATLTDPECIHACAFAIETGCILGMERTFYRPLFDGVSAS